MHSIPLTQLTMILLRCYEGGPSDDDGDQSYSGMNSGAVMLVIVRVPVASPVLVTVVASAMKASMLVSVPQSAAMRTQILGKEYVALAMAGFIGGWLQHARFYIPGRR